MNINCLAYDQAVFGDSNLAQGLSGVRLRGTVTRDRGVCAENLANDEIRIEDGVFYDRSSGGSRGRHEIDRIELSRPLLPEFNISQFSNQPIVDREELGNGGGSNGYRPGIRSSSPCGTLKSVAEMFFHQQEFLDVAPAVSSVLPGSEKYFPKFVGALRLIFATHRS